MSSPTALSSTIALYGAKYDSILAPSLECLTSANAALALWTANASRSLPRYGLAMQIWCITWMAWSAAPFLECAAVCMFSCTGLTLRAHKSGHGLLQSALYGE